MSDFEQKEIALLREKQQAWDNFRKGLLGMLLMLPANIVGFSQMYLPKYAPSDFFWWISILQLLMGLSYFFKDQFLVVIEFLKTKIIR